MESTAEWYSAGDQKNGPAIYTGEKRGRSWLQGDCAHHLLQLAVCALVSPPHLLPHKQPARLTPCATALPHIPALSLFLHLLVPVPYSIRAILGFPPTSLPTLPRPFSWLLLTLWSLTWGPLLC
jgi:hypothetical protein